jgi:hypothetical protein
MLGKGSNSLNSADTTFLRSTTYLDPTEFNGVAGHYWEILVANSHTTNSFAVQLVDEAGAAVATHNVAPLASPSNNALRMRTAFTPTAGPQQYRLKIPATPSTGNIVVYSSRLITVLSEESTQCVVQIPMCELGLITTALDTASTEYIDRATGGAVYMNESPDRHTWWQRDDAKLATITGGRLEVVCRNPSSDGSAAFDVALVNRTDGDATVVVLPVGTPAALSEYRRADFAAAAANFLDLKEYSVKLKTNGSNVGMMFKVNLYLKVNPIEHLEVWYRFMALNGPQASTSTRGMYRIKPGMEGATAAYMEATGRKNTETDVSSALLMNDGVNESGLGPGAVAVPGATISYTATSLSRVRTADFLADLVDGNRYIGRHSITTGSLTAQSSFLVVKFK